MQNLPHEGKFVIPGKQSATRDPDFPSNSRFWLSVWIQGNKIISKAEVSASHRHVSLKILNEFPKVLDKVSLQLGKQRDQFRISIESKVDNPLMTIESFNRQFQIGEKERESVERGWTQEARNTMFHVGKAYTRVAQFEGLSAEASYRLQKVGGMVVGIMK